MIDYLRVGKTANFHRLKRRLSNAAIDDLFRRVRASQPSASQNLFHHRRVAAGAARWSAIAFLYDRTPPFLADESGVVERACGFALVVEHRSHAAVFKARLDLPSSFSTQFLGRVAPERVDVAVASGDAVFQRIRLRNMSLSKLAMRNKTLEADDLRNAVGPAASSRYVPQGYSVRLGNDHYATTPSTGRITQRSDRVGHLDLVDYATAVIDELVDGDGTPAAFIRTFARSIDLASVEGAAQPVAFAIDVASLGETIFETNEVRLVRQVEEAWVALSKDEIEAVLGELGDVFEIHGAGKKRQIRRADGGAIGEIALNKTRIALRNLLLPLSVNVHIEGTDHALGLDPDRASLRQYLDRADRFIVLFDDVSLAYIDGGLFRDGGLADGGAEFLRYLRAEPMLDGVTDEKGHFTPAHTAFDADSTFGVVVAQVADGDEVLVCDDLGDEWADFIGLSNASTPRRITFYHAKHGGLSLGAGPFHVAVSQAMKNLGNMSLTRQAIAAKIVGWQQTYVSGSGVATSISRVIRGAGDHLPGEFEEARHAPDAIRRVYIVTSSLSRQAVQNVFDAIVAGERPTPHFVQLYWLLMSFFSACTEMNAYGYVVCRT